MDTAGKNSDELQNQLQLDENAVCDVCGRLGAFHFGDRTVCQDCYVGCGSCCPEFGKDDLWTFPDESVEKGAGELSRKERLSQTK